MAWNEDDVANRMVGPTKWIQIEDTVVPVVQRGRQDDGRVYDMLPWPVIKYGVNLPGQVALPFSPATAGECRHLSDLCEEAGFEFHFSEGTELIQLADFLRSYGDRVRFYTLPCDEPFRHLRTQTAGRDFNDPDEQPVDLSSHRTNSWTIDRDLEEAVSVINDPHNKLCYKITHKASIRSIKDQKILCLEQDNRQYVTLQKLYTAFFSHLSIAVFIGIIQLIGVPLVDLPYGYRNITDSIPEKMISADDVPMAIDRLEAELNRVRKLSRPSRSMPAARTNLDSGSSSRNLSKSCDVQGQATNHAFGSAGQRSKANDRDQCLGDISKDKGKKEGVTKCSERGLAVSDKSSRCSYDDSNADQVHDTKYTQLVSGIVKNTGSNLDGCNGNGVAANVSQCSLKREELHLDTAKDKERGLDSPALNPGQQLDYSTTGHSRHVDDVCKQPVDENSTDSRQFVETGLTNRPRLNDSSTDSEKHIISSGYSGKELTNSCLQELRGRKCKQPINESRKNREKIPTEGRRLMEVRTQRLDVSGSESEGSPRDTINKNCEQHTVEYRRLGASGKYPTYDKGKRLLEKISQIRRKKLKST